MGRWKRMSRLPSWRRISISTWRAPTDPSVYGWLDIDVSRCRAYCEKLSQQHGVKVTLTHLAGKAVAYAIAARPEVNAVIRWGREVYLRDTIDVFFQVAYEAGENLSGAKVGSVDRKHVVDVARELRERAAAIRGHAEHELARSDARLNRVPSVLRRPLLRAVEVAVYDLGLDLSAFGIPSDAFGSAMVTNVGSFGLPHGMAPLVPFARTPILLTLGAVSDAAVVEAGDVVIRPILSVGVTLDHRLIDGFQAGQLAQRFTAAMLDPEGVLDR